MNALSQIFIGAVLQGALYALGAFGLSLSFGVLKILNVSHGDFLMLGGLMGYFAFVHFGINPFIAAIIIGAAGFFVGAVYYRAFIERLIGRDAQHVNVSSVMITLGTSLVIEDITSFLWGGGSAGIPYALPSVVFAGLQWPVLRILLLAGTIILTIGLHYFFSATYIGRAIVAAAINPIGAAVVGIDIQHVALITFGLGIALAMGSGVFYGTLYSIDPFMGLSLTLKYLAVVVVETGLGSLPGALVGGFVVSTLCSLHRLFRWPAMVASRLVFNFDTCAFDPAPGFAWEARIGLCHKPNSLSPH